MSEKIVNRVLLSNDDGIDAPGMAILERIAHTIANDVWIVAPAQDRSGVSNSLSLREPVRIIKRDNKKYAVYGTPADCIAFAIHQVMADTPPDLVLSGVNYGSNIGFETLLSGTVGAAMTGMLHGIPAVAMSQDKSSGKINWDTALTHAPNVLRKLLSTSWESDVCLSINFPDIYHTEVKGIKITAQGMGTVKGISVVPTNDPDGEDYYWIRIRHGEQNDPSYCEITAVENGYISITPLSYERTSNYCQEKLLREIF